MTDAPILATDVHYGADTALAGGILFDDWRSDVELSRHTHRQTGIAPYRPGAFYERELPPLLALIQALPVPPGTVIIDGYVTLGAKARDGLGAHLYRALGGSTPVIGVAKSRFDGTPARAEILRGTSATPLFVTSRGMDPARARAFVRSMHGAHRLPTLLTAVDRLCRDALTATP